MVLGRRLPRPRAIRGGGGRAEAVAAATEAVWWITTADAMSRRRQAVYGHVLTALDPAARRAVEVSLTGLRFIRGQLGGNADPADFLEGGPICQTGARMRIHARSRSLPQRSRPSA
jgi:hypothetical protein